MRKKLKIIIPLLVLTAIVITAVIYTCSYYHADPSVQDYLETDSEVTVVKTEYGWFFNGPSEDNILVFYPGGKVEETAYAPLLHLLSSQGMDVCLVKMPFRLAFLGKDKADGIFSMYDHPNRYIGGHSLGGAFAAVYASGHASDLKGLVMLAAYPTSELDGGIQTISIYGSEDKVVSMDKIEAGRNLAGQYTEHVIEGGNHSQFGNYGNQKGDGTASLSRDEQQRRTAGLILGDIQ